jgi:hypothetical protein
MNDHDARHPRPLHPESLHDDGEGNRRSREGQTAARVDEELTEGREEASFNGTEGTQENGETRASERVSL